MVAFDQIGRLGSGIAAKPAQQPTLQNSLGLVHAEDSGRDLADGCLRFDDHPAQLEMVSPTIRPRIVEPREFTARRHGTNVAALRPITARASVCQIP